MTNKSAVRVVKRGERNLPQAEPDPALNKKTPQQSARDMVATVSEWVSDFQKSRRTDTKQALRAFLYEGNPHPSKA